MKSKKELIEHLERTSSIVREAIRKLEADEKTPEYKEKVKRAQEEDEQRNKGFVERGENWRDIEIA